MKLSHLLAYDNIIVQCHDNPDPDALASGMALLYYFKLHHKNVRFVYGGRYEIRKSNLCLMVKDLDIDVVHVHKQADLSKAIGMPENELPDLIVTVDCQYGEGNVTHFDAKETAIIDHHQQSAKNTDLTEIRSIQASCSTIIWDMMEKEGIDVNNNKPLATALYYGLMTDSGNFTEIHHPLDMDMRDELHFSNSLIIKFKNANLSQGDLKTAGLALLGYEYYEKNKYAIVKTEPCDPNILGVISDILLEVDSVDKCVVYNVTDAGIKLSVRSCTIETQANEMAEFVCEEAGNGGGHIIKAGGFINRKALEATGIEYDEYPIHQYVRDRVQLYFDETEVINAGEDVGDLTDFKRYKNKVVKGGFVRGRDIVPVGEKAVLRTLEGDIDVLIKEDTVFIIGTDGEVFPTTEKFFKETNAEIAEEYHFTGEYEPSIKNVSEGSSHDIISFAHACQSKGEKEVIARELISRAKVFTNKDSEKYSLGRPGDFLVLVEGTKDRVYVASRKRFLDNFEPLA